MGAMVPRVNDSVPGRTAKLPSANEFKSQIGSVPRRSGTDGMSLRAPDPPLSDGVVTLRPPDEGDLAAIDLGINDPEVVRWFGQPDASAIDVLTLNRRRWAEGSPTFAICEMDGICGGHVWMNLSTGDAAVGYVGYWLLPSARGRGLATRAVRLLSDWAVRDLGTTHLGLLTEPANEPSQRVAERSGFRRVGILADNGKIDGRSIDHVLFRFPPDDD
jgi:RimJ/RimL family protein N-acetyltransferase